MPTYGYRCTACGHTFERFQKITDPPVATCETCDAPVKKILYPVGIQFKGDGFYVNDYKSSGSKKEASKAADAPIPEAKSEAKPVESKPASDAGKSA